MSRRHFKFVLLALTFILIFSLGSAVLAQDATEMRLVWWGSQSRHDRTIAVVEMYEAENPGLDIVYEFANFNDYWTLMNTQAAGGELACVMQQDYAYLSEWARRDLLAPLDPFIEQGLLDTSTIDDTYLEGGRVDGQLYGMNLGSNSQSIILDLDAFEQAGMDLPDPQWTWDDFEQVATELHDKLGIYAYGSPDLGDDQIWTAMMVSLGVNPFNDAGTDFGYADDQPIIDHFNRLLRLQEAGVIQSYEEIQAAASTGPENSPIVTAEAAMQYQWSNQVVAIFSAAGENRHFKLWPMPRPEGARSANYLKPSMFFSIPEACEMKEEAAKFISFFVNDLEANEILFAERGVPVSSGVREHLQPMLDEVGAETFDFLERVAADASPIFPPNPPGYNDIRNNVWIPLFKEPVLYEQIPVEEGMAIFRSEAQAILAGNE